MNIDIEDKEVIEFLISKGFTPPWNYDMSQAPKDGTEVLLKVKCSWGEDMVYQGSFRVDEGFSGNSEPLWLDNSYDDWSTGYASTPLDPIAWKPII